METGIGADLALLEQAPKATPKGRARGKQFREDEDKLLTNAPRLSQQDLKALLDRLSEAYYNDVALVSDQVFDQLVEIYERKFGKYTAIRALPRGTMVPLPYYLGSLRKIKERKDIDNWSQKYPGPYIIEDKIDGLTLLYVQSGDERKLYTGGDGYVGQDVSHILPYLEIPIAPVDVAIRGELVMTKENFAKYGNGFANARNMTPGLLKAKKHFNPDLIRRLSYYPFQIVNAEETPENQIYYLREWGYETPHAVSSPDVDLETLTAYFADRAANAPYEVDGLVIYQNEIIEYPIGEDPKQAIAFKVPAEEKETEVLDIIWQPSSQGFLIPVVVIKEVLLDGAIVQKATGYNARSVINDVIGPGARVMVRRSGMVIPQIVRVVTPAPGGATLPDPEEYGTYHWNETNVQLVLDEPTDLVYQAQLKRFITKLGIKKLGPGRVKALYEAGITTPYELMNATAADFMRAEKFGASMADQAYEAIQAAIIDVPLPTIMTATGIFPSFGEKKFEAILDVYPDIINTNLRRDQLINQIEEIPGFSTKTATVFADKLPTFKIWLKDHPMVTYQPHQGRGTPAKGTPGKRTPAKGTPAKGTPGKRTPAKGIIMEADQFGTMDQDLLGQKIVFSGFRDKGLETQIKGRGGTVGTAISKSTTLLVLKNLADAKGKAEKAREYGIPMMSLAEFKRQYNFQ
jgi:NAD-dependent DNA ligase